MAAMALSPSHQALNIALYGTNGRCLHQVLNIALYGSNGRCLLAWIIMLCDNNHRPCFRRARVLSVPVS